jgi:hypothetical protein
MDIQNRTLQNLAIEVITSHYRLANELLNELANKHQIDIKKDPELWELRGPTMKKPAGSINEAWTYRFHGSGCDFINTVTQQFLYVNTLSGHYAKIDFYYLYKYMQTTVSLAHVAKEFPTFESFREIIFELEREKLLVDLGEYPEGTPYKDLFLIYLLK